MVNTNFATGGLLGAKIGDTHDTAQHALMTTTDAKGSRFMYVQADGAVTGPGYVVSIDPTGQAVMVSTSNDARGNPIGVAVVAMADNEYGWVQIKGPCQVRVAASAAANARLNTTATAGQIDDDGTSGAFPIEGLVLTTANGVSAGLAPAIMPSEPYQAAVI